MIKGLVITGAVLGGLFVGANMLAEDAAERAINDRLAGQLGLPDQASVEIESFPFILDVLGGHVDAVSVSVEGFRVQDLVFRELKVRLEDIEAEGSIFGSGKLTLVVGDTTGSAQTDDKALNAFLKRRGEDATVKLMDGKVTVSGTRSFAGIKRKVVASGRLSIKDGDLRFDAEQVTWEGPKPPGSQEAARRAASFREDLPPLPSGLRISKVEVRSGTISFSAVGKGQRFEVRA
ncbi:MAG: DUF2993 domain-containing protein [Actinomycetota bacterium]